MKSIEKARVYANRDEIISDIERGFTEFDGYYQGLNGQPYDPFIAYL